MHPRIHELLDYLDRERAALRSAVDSVPPHLHEKPPGAGRWSIAGVIEHLAIVEHRIAGTLRSRIASAREAGHPAESSSSPILPALGLTAFSDRATRVTASDAVAPTGLSADAAWSELERGGRAVRDAAATGDGLDLATVQHPHPRLGSLSLYQWIAFVGAHEARHAEQIRETGKELTHSA